MEKERKNGVGIIVGVMLGVIISLFLSFIGPAIGMRGHFQLAPYLVASMISFLCSSILSVLIGIFVPIKRITDSACRKANVKIEGFGGRCLAALIGDLIFTPFMTLLMVFMAYKKNSQSVEGLSFGKMYLGNLAVCLPVGFILLLIFTPICIKAAISIVKKHNQAMKDVEK